MLNRCRYLIAGLIAALAAGCGGSDGPKLYAVKGKVTKGGAPLAGVNVTFTPSEGPSSTGRTSDTGEFVLISQAGSAGAVAGKHKVTIAEPQAVSSGPVDMSNPATMEAMMSQRQGSMEGGRKGAPAAAEKSTKVPAEYSDPAKTPLEYEVTTSGADSFDIPIP
ncbi:MAG: carboxypeptidase regulatory-like domain-containing protein [Planctomyces sp.]|nr:carboxypeptidase regulatory-like domain-containing protein [Planctomyces sp.]